MVRAGRRDGFDEVGYYGSGGGGGGGGGVFETGEGSRVMELLVSLGYGVLLYKYWYRNEVGLNRLDILVSITGLCS